MVSRNVYMFRYLKLKIQVKILPSVYVNAFVECSGYLARGIELLLTCMLGVLCGHSVCRYVDIKIGIRRALCFPL